MQLFVVALVLPVLANLSGNFYVLGITVKRPILELLNSASYDPRVPPNFHSVETAEVVIQLAIFSIDSVREDSMDYSVTLYMRQFWQDDRLKFQPQSIKEFRQQMKESEQYSSTTTQSWEDMDNVTIIYTHTSHRLELDSRMKDKVWFPDTYFPNERMAKIHDVTVPNELVHIFHNGTVFNSVRMSLTLTCHMHLQKYPFDKQSCPLSISSFGYTNNIITYTWHKYPVLMNGEVKLPTFSMHSWTVVGCGGDVWGSIGNYSCIEVKVHLHRLYGYYIAQVYLPSIMLVVLSWVNFWLDVSATPARVSVGLLCVLTITTMGLGVKTNLPPVSYMKAIDIWFTVCFIFAFGALVEFAFVNVTSRVQNRRMTMKDAVKMAIDKEKNGRKEPDTSSKLLASTSIKVESSRSSKFSPSRTPSPTSAEKTPSSPLHHGLRKTRDLSQRERARLVDKVSRILFPAVFCCFNIFYWAYYHID